MTYQDFIKKNTARRLYFDNAYGAQCMDLYRCYVRDVWGRPQTPLVKGAYLVFDSLKSQDYVKVRNTAAGVPQPGDVIVWNEGIGPNGHIAVVQSADVNYFFAFQQNAPKADVNGVTGSPGNVAKYNYKNVIGWFRPNVPTPQPPTPMPQTYKEKLLVLLNNIPAELQPDLKTFIGQYQQRVADRTGGEYTLEITFAETPAVFHTLHGTNEQVGEIIYANPAEIVVEGHKVEVTQGKEFNAVCLIYNDNNIVGDKPNHPVDNPVFQEGFNVYSIPLSWISSLNDTSVPLKVYSEGTRLFFAHEGSHSKYYLATVVGGSQMRDRTHDVPPPEYQQWGQASEPPDFFISLLLELKPYWASLTAQTIGETMSILAFMYKGTVYLPIFAKYVPVSDQDTFLELGGNFATVKNLTDAEFNSIVKPYLAQHTTIG